MTQNRRIRALLTLKFLLIYSALALFVTSRQMPPTGDEPHYLVATHSLAVDGDLSLKENYLNGDYRLFYPGTLAKRTTFAPDRSRELPAFSPGLSMFLAPFYWLALHLFPAGLVPFLRLVICAVAVLGLYHVMLIYDRLGRTTDGMAILPVFALASPLITYSSMFYPEIVAFLLVVIAVLRLDEATDRPLGSAVWLSVLAPALIWLHPKYLALSFLLMLLSAYTFHRNRKTHLRWMVPLLQCAGIAAFFLFLHAEYGSWSPNRIYGGAQKETSLVELLTREGFARLWVMARMLIGYWIDQRFGLLVYAPAYIAFFPAVCWCVRKFGIRLLPSLLLFAAHFLLISWGAQMGGYSPPSRHFVVLLPLILLPILLVFSEWNRVQKWLFGFLGALGLLLSVLILTHYRLIFTNATWRNPDGYSEFWSWAQLQDAIPRLTATPPDFVAATIWISAAAILSWLLFPRRSEEM